MYALALFRLAVVLRDKVSASTARASDCENGNLPLGLLWLQACLPLLLSLFYFYFAFSSSSLF